MSEFLHAPAPAKINLSLQVLRRREDGFHELRSRMCLITLADRIGFRRGESGGIALQCDDPALPTGEENLAIKAVRAFEEATGLSVHGQLSIEKKIPSGAGLGGGSSDAASVLQLLDQAYSTGKSTAELAEIGASIGSDIPFFLYGQTCDVGGRGEIIEPVEYPHRPNLLLAKPPFGVSTPWAYGRWKDSEQVPGLPYAPQELSIGTLSNDLERPVFEKYLVLGDLKRWLLDQDGVDGALMSGSGATVFAVLGDGADADKIIADLRSEFGESMWAETTSVSG